MQLPGAANNNSHMFMHNSTINTYISVAREFQFFFKTLHVQMDLLIREKIGSELVRVNGRSMIIMFVTEKMYNKNKKRIHLLQENFKHYSFVVQIKPPME